MLCSRLTRISLRTIIVMKVLFFVILIGQYLYQHRSAAKWVRDADSKIVDEIKQNPSVAYLIQFHAPWFVGRISLDDRFISAFRSGADIAENSSRSTKKSPKKFTIFPIRSTNSRTFESFASMRRFTPTWPIATTFEAIRRSSSSEVCRAFPTRTNDRKRR